MSASTGSKTTIQPMPVVIELPASRIARGHCVILNDFEKPCGRLVCVVVDVEGNTAWCKYLNAENRLDSHNRGSGMWVSLAGDSIHNVTPLEKFGVKVYLDRQTASYVCEQVEVSSATYRDGSAREWQGWVGEVNKARADLIELIIAD